MVTCEKTEEIWLLLTRNQTFDHSITSSDEGDTEKLGNNQAPLRRSETYDLPITSSDVDSRKLGKKPSAPSLKSNLRPYDYSSGWSLEWRSRAETRKKPSAPRTTMILITMMTTETTITIMITTMRSMTLTTTKAKSIITNNENSPPQEPSAAF